MPQIDPQTETFIANQALSAIKVSHILSLDADKTDKAKVLRQHFAPTRDALQRRYPWNFNEAYLQLPAGGAAPPFRYRSRFPWTAAILGVRDVHGLHRKHWKVNGKSIIANCGGPLNVIASIRVVDVSVWDALFRTCMVSSLAYAVAPQLARDEETIERAAKAAESALLTAFPVDAGEGAADEPEEQDVILSRF